MPRSKHPGVWLVTRANRAGATAHFARWRDPVSGKRVEVSLDRLQLTNDRARERWARTKSAELARELQAIAAGDAPREPVALADAIAEYEADCEARQTVATLRSTRQTLEVLREWAAAQRIEITAELTPQRVATFARYLSTLRARRQASGKGTPRGARRYTDEPLHPRTVNRHLSTWKAILNKWRLWRLVALTSDDIRELTKPLRTQKEPPRFLAPHEIKALLEAAMRYDDDARRGVPPIAPVVLFGLLTGMRLGEIRGLQWEDCALGGPHPEVMIRSSLGEDGLGPTKTKATRAIDLLISPALRDLLVALRLRSGRARGFVFPQGDAWFGHLARRTDEHGGPKWNWLILRHTAATFLASAPGIFGAAAAFHASGWLGHAVEVMETYYARRLRGIAHDARTLEAAMQIEALAAQIVARVTGADSPADSPSDSSAASG